MVIPSPQGEGDHVGPQDMAIPANRQWPCHALPGCKAPPLQGKPDLRPVLYGVYGRL